ncbi:hypothetical protein B0H66DRAFT_170434 [Apodospora peruviana]|uniref:Very long-chain fatty acid transport protein n=1 Tax=Apodospora peruviana TaxID=516989 RepID=A0AAE0IM40_9PEZI|nr:hypothetical protein B0H66DRAFT_170434 [Apodospora peruviana]
MTMAELPLAATIAAAAAGSAYLNARFSLEHDLLLIKILGGTALNLVRAVRAGQVNVFYILEKRALDKKFASRPFILFEDKSYTYLETYQMVLRYGTWLKTAYGVKTKDIVALDCQNSDTFMFCWFGIWSIGATPAFINHHLTGKPLTHSLRASTARLVIVDPRVEGTLTEEVKGELPDMQFVLLEPELERKIQTMEGVRYPDVDRAVDSYVGMAILIYTSGTTGLPKPAVVSWAKINAAMQMTGKGIKLTPDDIFYTSMPLYHSSASCLGACAALYAGSGLAIGRRFSTKTFWKEIRAHNATAFQYVGETCRYLTVTPPEIDPVTGENMDKKHRVRAVCGNGLRPDVWDKFKERFGIDTIFEFYAATEGALGLWNRSRNDFAKGAIGRYGVLSAAYIKSRSAIIKIDDETEEPWRDPVTGFCQRAATGAPGEMLVKLPEDDVNSRFQGYYNNSAATDSKIMRDVFRKGDAWFRSGDLLRFDSDGRLYFSDRLGDTFRWKSENVSTAEVAQVIGLHPAVQEANVYGVQLPNHDGRAGCVAIVFTTGPSVGSEVLASLAEYARRSLPRYAVPLFLRVRKEVGLHNTGTNKQQKHALRQESVNPAKVQDDALFWLKDGTYVPFSGKDWMQLEQGAVKL